MFDLFGISERRAFIGTCFAMVGVDQQIDERELDKLFEVLVRYGFTEEEVIKEAESFSKMSFKDGMRHGQKCMAAITKLDSNMRKNLISSLTEIANADEDFNDVEKNYLNVIKMVLGEVV